jgi:hypothetical protein
MKQLFILTPLLFLFILAGCKKDYHTGASSTGIINTAPRTFAGADLYVVLPNDSATLNGVVYDDPSLMLLHSWKKISGPASYVIDEPGLLKTKVRNLLKGRYEFELTVRNNGGLTGIDTVIVDVQEPFTPLNDLIFQDLRWIFPWYASIEVKNINLYSAPKKVFIKRGFNTTWTEVNYLSNSAINSAYEYFIETRPDGAGMYNYGSLYIFYYGTITDDTPQVKIQF